MTASIQNRDLQVSVEALKEFVYIQFTPKSERGDELAREIMNSCDFKETIGNSMAVITRFRKNKFCDGAENKVRFLIQTDSHNRDSLFEKVRTAIKPFLQNNN